MGGYTFVLDKKKKSGGKQVAQASNSGFRMFTNLGYTVQPSLGIIREKLERIFKNALIEVLSVMIGVSCSFKHI